MSKTPHTLIDSQKFDTEVITSNKYKNSTNKLFGFNQNKIIILDANESSAIQLNTLLHNWQCDTQFFNSAKEALRLLTQREWKPRLIISNLFPESDILDIDEIKRIQNFYACDIQTIILIRDTDPINIQLANDNGFTILHKPINAAQLRFAMKKKLSIHTYQSLEHS